MSCTWRVRMKGTGMDPLNGPKRLEKDALLSNTFGQ